MSDKIYALYPLNKDGKAVGVYVGITSDVKRRIREHVYGGQYWFDDKPVTNFAYQILDGLDEDDDPYIEYDYIDLFRKIGLHLLNRKIGNHGNYQNAFLRLISNIDFHYKSNTKEV